MLFLFFATVGEYPLIRLGEAIAVTLLGSGRGNGELKGLADDFDFTSSKSPSPEVIF